MGCFVSLDPSVPSGRFSAGRVSCSRPTVSGKRMAARKAGTRDRTVFECDGVIRGARVSRSREQQAAAKLLHREVTDGLLRPSI